MLVFALVYPNHISKSTSAKGIFGISWIVAEKRGGANLGQGDGNECDRSERDGK